MIRWLFALAALIFSLGCFWQAYGVLHGPVMVSRGSLGGWMIIAGAWSGFFGILSFITNAAWKQVGK